MNNFFIQFKKEARTIRLTGSEKAAMQARIMQEMKPSPDFSFFALRSFSEVGPFQFAHIRAMQVMATVLLVALLGGGTAYAAQGSLPGDVLYTIKINVNEQVEGALALSDTAKAQWNTQVAGRRLEEAETLASKGELTAGASVQIESNFNEHADEAQRLTQRLSDENSDQADEISTELDSSLSAHSAILVHLGDQSPSSENKESSGKLARSAREHSGRGSEVAVTLSLSATAPQAALLAPPSDASGGVHSKSKSTASASSGDARTARQLQKNASSTIVEARSRFNNIHDSLDASTSAAVEARFSAIGVHMSLGSTALAAGDYALAKSEFQQALRLGVQIETYLASSQRLDGKFLPTLLNFHRDQSADDKSSDNSGSGNSDGNKNSSDQSNSGKGGEDNHGGDSSSGDDTPTINLHL